MARTSPNVLGDDDEELDTASFMLEACGIDFYTDFYQNERILTRENLEKNFAALKKMVDNRSFRRAPYFVIGYFILITGAELLEDLRNEILEAASWKHEASLNWLDKSNRAERKICLKDFRQKIRAHTPGQSLRPIRLLYPDGKGEIYTKYRSQTVIGLKEFQNKCKSGNIYDAKHLLLQGWGLKYIPEIIFKIKGLETLSLSANQIQNIPTEISNLKALKSLGLPYNQLTSLPDSIGKLSSLESLSLVNNDISSLPRSMRHLKLLKNIIVRGTQIAEIPEFLNVKRFDEYSKIIYF
ncbi:MAG: leucine-rich repeat domain-containing protein [Candidatus Lokiarchaeota archaeon]|nr:leucine-rich repeat domain-containing protein [Candidatus Lokiarchaeota archaeon]